MTKKQKKVLTRIVISACLTIGLSFLKVGGVLKFALYFIAYIIIGYDILKKAVMGIANKQVFDENFLMAIATIGAFALGINSTGDYTEAVAVMIFYQIGELFHSYAVGKSRKNIASLMDIRPHRANLVSGGEILEKHPSYIAVGSEIIVNPGEIFPIDGVIVDGQTNVNTIALTGESLPRHAKKGDEVLSGFVNVDGVVRVKTKKLYEESAVSKILDLVENASSKKSKSEKFISRFARVYTPLVCLCALLIMVMPTVIGYLAFDEWKFSIWLYRALTFLVISCPCALVISVPLSFFSCIGRAGSMGLLIKGSNYIEAMSKINHIVFDKTGTLTQGVFKVTDIFAEGISKDELLEISALGESRSNHPIAKSIVASYGKTIDNGRIGNIKEIAGLGVEAEIDGATVLLGNDKLFKAKNILYREKSDISTVVHVAKSGVYLGYISISDVIKNDSEPAIRLLKAMGIKSVSMLTGDSNSIGQYVAKKLGIDNAYCELLPDEKMKMMEQFVNSDEKGATVAFVGDGINDAPVLMLSPVGIAMGQIGSDAAIEAADVVIMNDNPKKICSAIRISKKCMSIVKTNIVFSLIVKFVCLILGALGYANMWFAIFADVGVMILAVLNSISILFYNDIA